MGRTIDADALIARFDKVDMDDTPYCQAIQHGIEIAKDWTMEAPTVQLDVRRGKCLSVDVFGEDPYACSECGNSVNVYGYDFCPNCGAKMDLEVDHE